jgi:hypothetical protein
MKNVKCAGCGKPLETFTMQLAEKLFHNVGCYALFIEAETKGTKRFEAQEVKM